MKCQEFTQITILDMIRYASSYFEQAQLYYGHGTANAIDEARYLIAEALHIDYAVLNEYLPAKLTEKELIKLHDLIDKRVLKRIPVAYLVNRAYFADLAFYVDERVLIPRSPIAEIIQQQFRPWIQQQAITDVLDLCTGSACIAIAIAVYLPGVMVDAVDISAEALAVAKRNVDHYDLADVVTLIQSDLFENVNRKYQVIVSNPPYVDHTEMQALPAEYQHEPTLALASGADGLDFTRRLLQQASDYLTDDGLLIVEVGASEVAFSKAFADLPVTWIEFAGGGSGVFVIRNRDVRAYNFH